MSELDTLGIINGTDKSSCVSYAWDYLRHYEKFFAPFKDKDFNLLEIGVLGVSSLHTWRDFAAGPACLSRRQHRYP